MTCLSESRLNILLSKFYTLLTLLIANSSLVTWPTEWRKTGNWRIDPEFYIRRLIFAPANGKKCFFQIIAYGMNIELEIKENKSRYVCPQTWREKEGKNKIEYCGGLWHYIIYCIIIRCCHCFTYGLVSISTPLSGILNFLTSVKGS